MRPLTQGDILAAARVLVAQPEPDWSRIMAKLLDAAARADRHRRAYAKVHPRLGNGSLMAAAYAYCPAPPCAFGDRRYLAAMGVVIAAVLARSERLEGHGGQGAADAGDIE